MALARTITVMDVYDRAKTGEKVEEKDWDLLEKKDPPKFSVTPVKSIFDKQRLSLVPAFVISG